MHARIISSGRTRAVESERLLVPYFIIFIYKAGVNEIQNNNQVSGNVRSPCVSKKGLFRPKVSRALRESSATRPERSTDRPPREREIPP